MLTPSLKNTGTNQLLTTKVTMGKHRARKQYWKPWTYTSEGVPRRVMAEVKLCGEDFELFC